MTIDPTQESFLPPSPALPPLPSRLHKKIRVKPQRHTHWLEEPREYPSGEVSLWRAVIMQAVVDALSSARTAESALHKHEAIGWLMGGGKDFSEVCLLAEMEPEVVRRKAKKALLKPSAWRAAPGCGKRYEQRKAYRHRKKIPTHVPVHTPHAPQAQILPGPWGST